MLVSKAPQRHLKQATARLSIETRSPRKHRQVAEKTAPLCLFAFLLLPTACGPCPGTHPPAVASPDGSTLGQSGPRVVRTIPNDDDSCRLARNGTCDDMRYIGAVTTACPHATDGSDCRGMPLRAQQELLGNACQWAFDEECDHPGVGTGLCQAGTDVADCGGRPPQSAAPTAKDDSCQFARDGECSDSGISAR